MKGIQFIHGCGICHRDIKLDNILFDETYLILKLEILVMLLNIVLI